MRVDFRFKIGSKFFTTKASPAGGFFLSLSRLLCSPYLIAIQLQKRSFLPIVVVVVVVGVVAVIVVSVAKR